jgi:hypothetical protein
MNKTFFNHFGHNPPPIIVQGLSCPGFICPEPKSQDAETRGSPSLLYIKKNAGGEPRGLAS